ncbi:hypothetical protein [Mycolicibacterium cosmeticum]|uniref:hypothetical protein n=1 Tax=Mycolicibacterium cosmeticum TaxID=258533 RepID=UPI003204C14E
MESTATEVIGTAPAATTRRVAMSQASTDVPPEAAVTMKASLLSAKGCFVRIAKHTSIHKMARVVSGLSALTTSTAFSPSSEVLMYVRSIGC